MTTATAHNSDQAQALALQCLTYLIDEEDIFLRFLSLTGSNTDMLREKIHDPEFLISILGFFVDHEPDLIEISKRLDIDPTTIVHAWRTLGGGVGQDW